MCYNQCTKAIFWLFAFGGVLDSTFGLMRDKHVVGSATLKRNVKIKRKKQSKELYC